MSLQNRILTLESDPLQTSNSTQRLQVVNPTGQAAPEQLSFSFAEEYAALPYEEGCWLVRRHSIGTLLVAERAERLRCCCCGKSFGSSAGYLHPRGSFYCDEDIWLLAENGEFYCGE
jgi:hypothetical protein